VDLAFFSGDRLMMPSHNNNVGAIRFLLAIGVVIGHLGSGTELWSVNFPFVPAFISLSGYLISQSMERSRDYLHFAWKRLLRVMPAFLVSLVVMAFVGYLPGALLVWATFGLMGNAGMTNGVLWSLSVEEVLYALLAAGFATGIFNHPRRAILVLATTMIVSPLFMPLPEFYANRALDQLFFFCGGCLLYVCRAGMIWSPAVAGVLSLPLILSLVHIHTLPFVPAPWSYFALPYVVLCLGLYARPVLGWFEKLGDPSYGMYIYHTPLIYLGLTNGIKGWFLVWWTLVNVLFFSFLSWHLIEKQALKLKDWNPFRPASAVGQTTAHPQLLPRVEKP
jgi:peptidoglycan/LPS O-acetylase OafA/YrhL